MTLQEATQKLRIKFPDRTLCVTVDIWTRPDGGQNTSPRVTVFSIDGDKCLGYEGPTIAEAVDNAIRNDPEIQDPGKAVPDVDKDAVETEDLSAIKGPEER